MSAISIDERIPTLATPRLAAGLIRTILLGLAVGLGVQALALLALAWQGQVPQAARVLPDTAQLLTWSTLACACLVAGQSAARIGLVLLGTPVALVLAHAVQTSVLGALTGGDIHGATPWLEAGVRGLEFAFLGALLLWLSQRRAGVMAHAVAGVAVGGLAFVLGYGWLGGAGEPAQRAVAVIAVPFGAAIVVFLARRTR